MFMAVTAQNKLLKHWKIECRGVHPVKITTLRLTFLNTFRALKFYKQNK